MMNDNKDGIPRRKIQEALELFSEIEKTNIVDDHDVERLQLIHAAPKQATPQNSARREVPKKPATKAPLILGKKTSTQQPHVDEVILKQLHKKNQQLQSEISALKDNRPATSGGRTAVQSVPEKSVIESLKFDLAQRDIEIQKLKRSISKTDEGISRGIESIAEERRAMLEEQYKALVDVKLECVYHGESTGKVNKEVKSFFTALKNKTVEDAAFFRAERVALNERILELEEQLAIK